MIQDKNWSEVRVGDKLEIGAIHPEYRDVESWYPATVVQIEGSIVRMSVLRDGEARPHDYHDGDGLAVRILK
jgi:hypothetical protein